MTTDFRFPIVQLRHGSTTEPAIDGLEYCAPGGMDQAGNAIAVRLMPTGLAPCIHVDMVPFPIAEFGLDPSVGDAPLHVEFANQSHFADAYVWHFGDGTTSPETHPDHTYAAGSYTVTLYARNLAGQDSRTGGVTATVPGCGYDGEVQSLDTPGDATVGRARLGGALIGDFDVRVTASLYTLEGQVWNILFGLSLRSGSTEYRLAVTGDPGYPYVRAAFIGPNTWTEIAHGADVEPEYPSEPSSGPITMSLRLRRQGGRLDAYWHNGSAWTYLGYADTAGAESDIGIFCATYVLNTPDLITHIDGVWAWESGCPNG